MLVVDRASVIVTVRFRLVETFPPQAYIVVVRLSSTPELANALIIVGSGK